MTKTTQKRGLEYFEIIEIIIEKGENLGFSTQKVFSENTGVNQAYISMIYIGREILPENQLTKLMLYFKLGEQPIIFPRKLKK